MQPKKTRKGIKLNLVLRWRETKLKVCEGRRKSLPISSSVLSQ